MSAGQKPEGPGVTVSEHEKLEQRMRRFAHALACLADVAKDVQADGMGFLALHGMHERFREVITDALRLENMKREAWEIDSFVTVPRDKLEIVLGYFRSASWPDTKVGNAAYTLNDFIARQMRPRF